MTCHRFRIAEIEGKAATSRRTPNRSNAATTTICFGSGRLGGGIDYLELSFPARQTSTTKRQRECERERATVSASFATTKIATLGTIKTQHDAGNRAGCRIAGARG